MLNFIHAVTFAVPDLQETERVYTGELGYQVRQRSTVPADLAASWGAPAVAEAQMLIIGPENGEPGLLRFVQQDKVPGYTPFHTYGWNCTEIIVQDVEALNERLKAGPFKVIGAPRDLAFTDQIRAMQVLGPSDEVLYLTQFKSKMAEFDSPEPLSFVGHTFITVLGGPDLQAMLDFYEKLGVPPAPVMTIEVGVLADAYQVDHNTLFPLSALAIDGQAFIEVDEYPEAATARPVPAGGLPPAMAMVSFGYADLDALPIAPITPPAARTEAPYNGRRACVITGAAGELIEVIELG